MERKFTNTCRTCYQYKPEHCLISLYETEEMEKRFYKDMLYDCTSIKVFTTDNLPSVICNQCAAILTIAYKFKRECYQSDQKFKTKLQENVTNVNGTTIDEDQKSYSQDLPDGIDDYTTNVITHPCRGAETEIKEIKRHFCDVCSKTFNSEEDTLEHRRIHEKGLMKESNMCCKFCSKTFDSAAMYEKHLNEHLGMKHFICNCCNRSFTKSGSLMRHMQNSHSLKGPLKIKKKPEYDNRCTYCGKIFKSAYDLTVHVRRHTGSKPYACKVCNMSFVSMGRLTSHSRMHTGETPFKCKICPKAFSHSSTLYRHVQSHKKPHICDFCQKRFTFPSCLETHKRMHSGEKPHVCKTCGKGFTEKKLLQRHYVVHENEKPHLCNVCGKNFKRTATLKKHLKTQHANEEKSDNAKL